VCKKGGSYTIVEIKGEDMADDAVVKAKENYATQLATGSGFTYKMIPGKDAKHGLQAA
jgi:type III restriction enzyme